MLSNVKPVAKICHIYNTEGTGGIARSTGKFAQKEYLTTVTVISTYNIVYMR